MVSPQDAQTPVTSKTGILPPPPREQVALQTIVVRRRRVIRSVIGVLILMLIMLTLSLMNRYEQGVEVCRQQMQYAVQEFQRSADAGERSPDKFPLRPTDDKPASARGHVYYNWMYAQSMRAEVGVCCCQGPHPRVFQAAGRYVIILDVPKRRYKLVWMNETEFNRRADDLGLHARGP